MLKLSACVEMVFCEYPFAERPARARAAGFDAYEFWGWENKPLDALADSGVPCAACCVGTRDEAVRRALANNKLLDRRNAAAFADAVAETARETACLGVKTLIATTGNERSDRSRGMQHDAVVECLRAGAKVAEKHGLTLVLEPLNHINHPGYFLTSSAEAFQILREVDSPAVKLLYDIYHQQITEGYLIPTICDNLEAIGHFHAADVPGRHEPGTGEIAYQNVLDAIDQGGYDRYVGFEYAPSGGRSSEETARDVMLAAR